MAPAKDMVPQNCATSCQIVGSYQLRLGLRLVPTLNEEKEQTMTNNVYSVVEIVGTSEVSISEAIQNAIAKATETLRNLEWFEIGQIRGWVKEGKVGHYQVTMKLGLRYEK
jgi:dodecin